MDGMLVALSQNLQSQNGYFGPAGSRTPITPGRSPAVRGAVRASQYGSHSSRPVDADRLVHCADPEQVIESDFSTKVSRSAHLAAESAPHHSSPGTERITLTDVQRIGAGALHPPHLRHP